MSYPIGKAGEPWSEVERSQWLRAQSIKRSYADEVVAKLTAIPTNFTVQQYGALSHDANRYPLYVATTKTWDNDKQSALITGGVHGYETSGVQGALRFLLEHSDQHTEQFNLVIAPCISPWGYETINRWNPQAIDPNRSFTRPSNCEESAQLIDFIDQHECDLDLHIDLHETTDTDNSEFRPALAARDAIELHEWAIPDGFYLVGDSENPQHEFQTAIINAVKKVTHIAPADENGKIIGEVTTQHGVINYANKKLGLCAGLSDSQFCTTTEVYPDSPLVDDENCIQAQVAAVEAALRFVSNYR